MKKDEIFYVLMQRTYENKDYTFTVREIMKLGDIVYTTVYKLLRQAKSAGLIEKTRHGGVYKLNPNYINGNTLSFLNMYREIK